MNVEEQGYPQRGLCRVELFPEAWFPASVEELTDPTSAASEAVRVCHRCPVRVACATGARERGEGFGTWGGVSFELEARGARRARRQSVQAPGPVEDHLVELARQAGRRPNTSPALAALRTWLAVHHPQWVAAPHKKIPGKFMVQWAATDPEVLEEEHGRAHTYAKWGCRCRACREAQSDVSRRRWRARQARAAQAAQARELELAS